MDLINRTFSILIFLLINLNLNAKTVEQFFIKITPNQELVNCGKLEIKKSKTNYHYFVKDQKVDIIKPEEALNWINDSLKTKYSEDSKVLFFIHGFWASLPFALHRTAKDFQKNYFKNDSTKVVAIIHLIWDANDIYYKSAIHNLNLSTNTLSQIFNQIPDNITFNKSLMCHSMGNRFLHTTLHSKNVNVLFHELLLIAPDLDYRKYENNPQLFTNLAEKVVVFFHTKDKTLRMSKGINKIERLGRLNKSTITDNIKFIDCTDINDINSISDSVMRHLYFITSNTVRKQIEQIINN